MLEAFPKTKCLHAQNRGNAALGQINFIYVPDKEEIIRIAKMFPVVKKENSSLASALIFEKADCTCFRTAKIFCVNSDNRRLN
jgi:hypothetical protein